MRPRTWGGWLAAAVVLLVAGTAAAQFVVAAAEAATLVDMIPGADAGLATSAALESARARSTAWGLVLLGSGVGTGGVLLRRSRRRSRPDGLPAASP